MREQENLLRLCPKCQQIKPQIDFNGPYGEQSRKFITKTKCKQCRDEQLELLKSKGLLKGV